MDGEDQMHAVAASTTTPLVDFLTGPDFTASTNSNFTLISDFRAKLASRGAALLDQLRRDFLSGERGVAPASSYLSKTRAVYEYVRVSLGIRMHGSENYTKFINGLGSRLEDATIGQNISRIYEAIRDGKMQAAVVTLFS